MVGWALWLLTAGDSWRACVLSYAWCTGDGAAVPSPAGGGGELSRRAVVVLVGLPAVLLNCIALRRVFLHHRQQAAAAPAVRRVRSWLAASSVGQLCVSTCLLAPMSCAALQPDGWAYLGWNDVAHDCGLAGLFGSLLAGSVAVGPTLSTAAHGSTAGAVACIVPMLALANDCPTLPDHSRRHVLALEMIALFCAQLTFVLSVRDIDRANANARIGHKHE